MFELVENLDGLSIGVFGIGGCGCNTVNTIFNEVQNPQTKFYCVNTDKVVLV